MTIPTPEQILAELRLDYPASVAEAEARAARIAKDVVRPPKHCRDMTEQEKRAVLKSHGINVWW